MNDTIKVAVIASIGVLVAAIVGGLCTYQGIVKAQNTEITKLNLQRVDQYKLAALEQRLKVHQETYKLAKLCLLNPRNAIKLKQLHMKLDNIYMNKSLYLDDESRKKLVVAMGNIRNAYEHPNNINNIKDNAMMSLMDFELINLCDALLNGVHLSTEPRNNNVRGI